MKKVLKMKKILTIALLAGFAQAGFAANDIVLTAANSRAGTAASLDLVTDGNVVMMQARVEVGNKVAAENVDLSACVAGLPKTHRGECHFTNGQVLVLVYNDEQKSMPAGVLNIGKITVRGAAIEPRVTEFIAADAKNAHVEGSIRSEARK